MDHRLNHQSSVPAAGGASDMDGVAHHRDVRPVDLRVEFGHGATTLTVSGELDLFQGTRLESTLRRLEERDQHLDVNLAGVTFADTYGLDPLFASARRRQALDTTLSLRDPSRPVARLLGILGIEKLAPLEPESWEAADRPSGGSGLSRFGRALLVAGRAAAMISRGR
jgi:anti-sigma B factor antagonist